MQKWYETLVGSTILEKKYFHEGENFEDFLNRVSGIFSEEIRDEVRKAIKNADLLPAGRTLYGAGCKGSRKVSMQNCFILKSPRDNLESIYNTCKEAARIGSYGGGVGVCIDNLRPKGAKVNNSAKESTGAVSFMNLFNTTGSLIGQNNRRMAIMIALSCEHPDIEEFLQIKKDGNKLESANISIKFTDEFMRAVENNENFTLHFDTEHEHIEKVINARDFFMEFCRTQFDFGDPGAIFIDRVRNYNLLSKYEDYKIDVSNPCVSGDTLILTMFGYKPIKECVGVKTVIWNGYEWSTVTPKVTGHNQKMLRITLSNGMSLDCTTYHNWILKDNKRVKAKDLKVGQELARWSYPIPLKAEITESKEAYTKGVFAGTGISVNGHIHIDPSREKIIPYIDYQGMFECDGGKRLIPKRNFNKYRVPFDEDRSYKLSYLAGILDSNAVYEYPTGKASISSQNLDFLEELQLFLSALGVPSHISKTSYPVYYLYISGWYMKQLYDLGMNTHLENPEYFKHPQYETSTRITIQSIEEIEDAETVYCFNEPLKHTGLFNGIMTGQCAEYFGNAGNSCLLASVNLYHCVDNPFSDNPNINWAKLGNLTSLGVKMLNETGDYGYDMLPLDSNRKNFDEWRSIGLGVFGLADMLVAMKMRYGSPEAIALTNRIMQFMFIHAIITSNQLAEKNGAFKKYDKLNFCTSDIMEHLIEKSDEIKFRVDPSIGLRNGSLLSIAPTGSIATMTGESGGVEPLFAISYERTTHSSENEGKHFRVFAQSVADLLEYHNLPKDLSDEEVKKRFPWVVTAYDIKPLDRIKMQAAMQEWVDNSISSTINLPHEATVEDIYNIYINAWKSGLKGITVFRDGCKRANILGVKEDTFKLDTITTPKRRNIERVDGTTIRKSTACVKNMYVTVNSLDDKPMEVFTNISGGCQANINTISRLAAKMLQAGIKVDEVIAELKESVCQGCLQKRREGHTEISPSCGNAIGEALEAVYKNPTKTTKTTTSEEDIHSPYMICPECGEKKLRALGKCVQCDNCGYSKCD